MVFDFSPTLSINTSKNKLPSSVVFDFSRPEGESYLVNFLLKNNSYEEVEVWGELILETGGETFKDGEGFYGSFKPWILQPLTTAVGNRDLGELINGRGIKLKDFIGSLKDKGTIFSFRIKYRTTTKSILKMIIRRLIKDWDFSSKQRFYYDFGSQNFWLYI